jgi:hypothetical protein
MVQADNHYAFRKAAENGRLEILKWLQFQAPNKFLAMVQAESHEAFRSAAANGHLEILKWLQLQAADEFLAMVQADNHYAFRWAAQNGYLEILKWLQHQAPDEFLAMVQAESHYAFSYAAENGHLEILKWLQRQAPNKFLAMVQADNHYAFRWTAQNGRLEILQWLQRQAPNKFLAMVRVKNYQAFCWAAENGHLEILQWLQRQAPNKFLAMVQAENHYAFRKAAKNGRLEILKWLQLQAPTELLAMVQAQNHEAFRSAAVNGRLEILKWLQLQAPTEFLAMVQADNYYAFRSAAEWGHLETIKYLLLNPSCLAHAEMHPFEYGNYVNPFINNQISSLKQRSLAVEADNPNAVFNLTSPDEIQSCFYIMRNLIRRNDRTLDEELLFLLSIPAVKALAHTALTPNQPNELVRLALTTGNTEAADILLSIPAVRDLAQAANFYRDEAQGRLDLRALAQDRESSMKALSKAEQKRLEAAITKYQPMIQAAGIDNIMSHLRDTLLERYQANPAEIKIADTVIQLPATWEEFKALQLTPETEEEALIAYRKNKDHSAWRYLLKPNPWMANNASYVYVNPARPQERYSTFEEYQPLISMLWLAAIDSTTPVTDGHDLKGRIDHFIDELALLGRAHNWDTKRPRPDGTEEEFDDLQGDKPSCYSGVKRRLFQSVIGHPLLKIVTIDDIKMELRDFVREHFSNTITENNRKEIKDAFDYYFIHVEYADETLILKSLNISELQQQQFIAYLTNKYQVQFTDSPEFKKYLTNEFSLRQDKGKELDYAHVLKFNALAGVYDDLLSKLVAKTDAGAKRLLFENTNFFSNGVNNNKRIKLEQQSDDEEDKVNEPI